MQTEYTSQQMELANEIANALNDRHSLAWHLQNTQRFPEAFLRKKFNHVMSRPDSAITKSRAHLYTFLINQALKYGDPRY